MITRAYAVAEAPEVHVLVAQAPMACCSIEVDAAVALGLLVPTAQDPVTGPAVLLVAGTVTRALAPALMALREQLPGGSPVLAFGACATSGGPYWDAPEVIAGAGELFPVDVYVPGCPPSPHALVAALLERAEAAS